jgi:RecA-family ATPase
MTPARNEALDDERVKIDAPLVGEVKREHVLWLWPGRIPFGKLTLLDGDPGLGKSTVALDIAAKFTSCLPLPGGYRHDLPGNVILLSAEDDIADTIRPRLDAAGADLDRVRVVRAIHDKNGERPAVLPKDIDRLEGLIDEDGARLVIIDPLMAFLDAKIDSHRDQDVRRALHALAKLAAKKYAALICLRHLNKVGGGNSLYRGGGSIGIIGAARSAMLIAPEPEDEQRRITESKQRRIIAMTKNNLGPMPRSLAYKLVEHDKFECARVVWDGESDLTADDLLIGAPLQSKRDDACEWLERLLEAGPVPVNELKEKATAEGFSWSTVERAKRELGIKAKRTGDPGKKGGGMWSWRLPVQTVRV